MLLAGDECRRTQRGNNNAYCQDNEISWFDWSLAKKNESLVRFVQTLIAFRRREPTVRQRNFLTGLPRKPGGLPDVMWFRSDGRPMEWRPGAHSLVCFLGAVPPERNQTQPNHHLLMIFHSATEPTVFVLPSLIAHLPWKLFINTAAEPPADIYPDLDGPSFPPEGKIEVQPRTFICYVAPEPL